MVSIFGFYNVRSGAASFRMNWVILTQCDIDAAWNPPPVQCLLDCKSPPQAPVHGDLCLEKNEPSVTHGTSIEFCCSDGHRISVSCTNGTWSKPTNYICKSTIKEETTLSSNAISRGISEFCISLVILIVCMVRWIKRTNKIIRVLGFSFQFSCNRT